MTKIQREKVPPDLSSSEALLQMFSHQVLINDQKYQVKPNWKEMMKLEEAAVGMKSANKLTATKFQCDNMTV
ncbi:hypothetical protein H5410_059269 [Solanum commersonii]|uniref:Uncharacterized protein n=1 Tax=Solanum commersonii TaxID=4109 RepID=A0A9J5W2A4_SOLCO|nr:hypothetical protein H5410_059269 [Solanum commersonii]